MTDPPDPDGVLARVWADATADALFDQLAAVAARHRVMVSINITPYDAAPDAD